MARLTEPHLSTRESSLSSCTFYTPAALAAAMVQSIMDKDAEWLDPCVGAGAFTEASADAGLCRRQIHGVDLDKTSHACDARALITRGVDFINWAQSRSMRFDRVVANPPYIDVNRLPVSLRRPAMAVRLDDEPAVSLGANYWCAFLCRSLDILSEGGSVCFLLPASWEYANYAARLRSALPGKFANLEVHRSISPLFSHVQEGSVVLVGRRFRHAPKRSTYFEYQNLEALAAGLGTPAVSAAHETVEVASLLGAPAPIRAVPLRDVMHIGIGAVTGDSRYFLMSEQRREELGLPLRVMHPMVTRARDLATAFLDDAAWAGLRAKNARVWLFRPAVAAAKSAAVRDYLGLALAQGGCNRKAMKVADRDPWFRTPLPRPPDGFMSGMSRWGPWICLRRKGDVSASNTLYTVHFRHRLSPQMKAAWCLSLLTSEAQSLVKPLGRRYPGGLLKYEPRDLESVLLPVPRNGRGAIGAYRQAVEALLADDRPKAARIADSWFAQNTTGGHIGRPHKGLLEALA